MIFGMEFLSMVGEVGWARCMFSVTSGSETRVFVLHCEHFADSWAWECKSFHRIVSISTFGILVTTPFMYLQDTPFASPYHAVQPGFVC